MLRTESKVLEEILVLLDDVGEGIPTYRGWIRAEVTFVFLRSHLYFFFGRLDRAQRCKEGSASLLSVI
jgi:hypothetical protein